VHSRIKNRAAVGRSSETERDRAEVARHGRGLSAGEVKKLQPGFTRGPIDIVDASFDHREGTPDDSLQHFDRLAARRWEAPHGARPALPLHVVEVGAIPRLVGYKSNVVCDLDGIPARSRDLPNLIISGSVRAEVDPPAVAREGGDMVSCGIKGEATRLAT